MVKFHDCLVTQNIKHSITFYCFFFRSLVASWSWAPSRASLQCPLRWFPDGRTATPTSWDVCTRSPACCRAAKRSWYAQVCALFWWSDEKFIIESFRLVESQRIESLRQAEARANSFLNPYTKGKTVLALNLSFHLRNIFLIKNSGILENIQLGLRRVIVKTLFPFKIRIWWKNCQKKGCDILQSVPLSFFFC